MKFYRCRSLKSCSPIPNFPSDMAKTAQLLQSGPCSIVRQCILIWSALTSAQSRQKKHLSLPSHCLPPFILSEWPTRTPLCSQDSSAARSQYWSRICTEILYTVYIYIYKKLPQPVSFYIPSKAHWLDPQIGEIKRAQHVTDWLHLVFSRMAPGTWCNQTHRGECECECVWSCEPAISSAADDQVGGENDLWAVQKGRRSTPP